MPPPLIRSPNLDVANASVPAYGVINLFFAGFLLRIANIGLEAGGCVDRARSLQPWIYLFIESLFIAVFCIGAWAALRFITHIKR